MNPTIEIETDVLTVAQAAKYLQVSPSTMQRLIASGSVTSVKIGRARRVRLSALKIYISNLEKQSRLGKRSG